MIAEMKDFSITLDHPTVKAGKVKIGVRNTAGQGHSLVVIRTELAPEALPVDQQTGKAKEDGKAGEIASVPANGSASVTLDLSPGHYVVICNFPEHYATGMHALLIVE